MTLKWVLSGEIPVEKMTDFMISGRDESGRVDKMVETRINSLATGIGNV